LLIGLDQDRKRLLEHDSPKSFSVGPKIRNGARSTSASER